MLVSFLYYKKFKKRLWYKLYADDLVLIIHNDEITFFASMFLEVSDHYGLIVNKKKSGIISIKFKEDESVDKICGFPVLD